VINIAIIGYGNLGKGVENAIQENSDINLVGIFTRRILDSVTPMFDSSNVYPIATLKNFKGKIDVCILCGGSKTDILNQAPEILKNFNCVDSFDTHAVLPEYLSQMDAIGKQSKTLSIIAGGWDPGLFSLQRLIFSAFLPTARTHTFWGKGVSQGHTQALKDIKGVKCAVQYTMPNKVAIKMANNGKSVHTTKAHTRLCYVVLDGTAPADIVKQEIVSMPNYFKGFTTLVNFISEQEFNKKHNGKLSHGGMVMQAGTINDKSKTVLKTIIKLNSNPNFTGSVLVALARACYRYVKRGKIGALTMLDIAPVDYSAKPRDILIKELL